MPDESDPRTETQKHMYQALAFQYDDDWYNYGDALRIGRHVLNGGPHEIGTARCCDGAEPLYTPEELRAGRNERPWSDDAPRDDGCRDWWFELLDEMRRSAVLDFIDQECVPDPQASVEAHVLYCRFGRWWARLGCWLSPPPAPAFDEEMRARFEREDQAVRIVYVGLRLPDIDPADDPYPDPFEWKPGDRSDRSDQTSAG